jgi:O-antigen/teichoic acid export membrane protein
VTNNNSKIYKRLKRGGIWATLGKIIFVISTLLWNALLTRIITKEEVGGFYLIASIVIIGELVVLGGMNQVVMRLISFNTSNKELIRPILKGTIALILMAAFVSALVYINIIGPYLGYKIFNSSIVGGLVELTAAWFVLRAIQTYLAFVLRGFHRISIAAFLDGATTSLLITLVFVFIWTKGYSIDITAIMLAVVGALVSTVVLTLLLLRKNYQAMPVVSGIQIKEPVRIGVPLSILSLTAIGFNEAHIWIIGAFADQVEVAIYGAASRLGKFVTIPLIIVNGIIPSSVSQLHALNDKKSIQKILQTFALITALITGFTAIVLFLYPKEMLALLFGESYAAGWGVLVALIVGHMIGVLVGSPGVLMAMTDHQNISMIIGIFSGLIGIAISMLLINTYGALGVAIGASVGIVIHNISMWLYCMFVIKVKTHASIAAFKNLRQVFKI